MLRAGLRAVFLDRDGVINERAAEHNYVKTVAEFRILPGVPQAIARLNSAGFLVIVVTNQRGLARGIVDLVEIDRMHELMRTAACHANGRIENVYLCPHDLHDCCECRKPSPGMLLQAERDFGVDLRKSWMIGDSESDVEAGRRVGCQTVLITADLTAKSGAADTYAAASLPDAVDLILEHNRSLIE